MEDLTDNPFEELLVCCAKLYFFLLAIQTLGGRRSLTNAVRLTAQLTKEVKGLTWWGHAHMRR